MDRRQFIGAALAAGGGGVTIAADSPPSRPVCAFVKFLQSLSFDELASTVAGLGFDGIEATVRRGGQVSPERVEEDLPPLVEALRRQGSGITLMATDVNRADDAAMERTLRTAAALGVRRYRMAYYRYDLSRPIRAQLDNWRPLARELAALNRELGLTGVYQNHAGAQYVGASLWDLDLLLGDISPDDIGCAFDIRHATAEGGTTWPTLWALIEPRVRAVYVKDFVWENRKPENVPLGKGQVAPEFFLNLALSKLDPAIPVSLHVEYLPEAGAKENVEALRTDLALLETYLSGG